MQQTFSYYVGGSGKCTQSHKYKTYLHDSNENHDRYDKEKLTLDSNLLIYSNFEQTMSFMIHLDFDSFKIKSKFNKNHSN